MIRLLCLVFFWLLTPGSPDAATVAETWTAANADPIDADQTWTDDPFTGSGDFELNTNRIRTEAAGLVEDDPRLEVNLGTASQSVTAVVTVGQPSSGSNYIGPSVHHNAGTTDTHCGCVLLVNSSAQEFLRAQESSAGTITQTSCGVVYTAGATATVKAEMTAGNTVLSCTYDPGGANEDTCSVTCDVAETNFAGIAANQSSGGALGDLTMTTYTVTTADAETRRRFPRTLP